MENMSVRVMTIITDVNNPKEMTIFSSNLERTVTFYKDQIGFLEEVLKNLKEKSKNLQKGYRNCSTFF